MKKSTEMMLLLGSALFINHEYKDICKEADELALKEAELAVYTNQSGTDLRAAEKNLKAYQELEDRIRNDIRDRENEIIDWDEIKRLRNDAEEAYKNGVAEFKKSIDYEGKKNELGLQKVKNISEGLKNLDYADTLKRVEKDISDVNNQIDDLNDLIDNLDLDNSDSREVRRAGERSLKEKLNKLKREKENLISSKDRIVSCATKEYNAGLKELDDQVKLKKDELAEICRDQKKSIEEDISNLKKQANDFVMENLSEEDANLLDKGHDYRKAVEKYSGQQKNEAKDIYNKLSKTDKLATYAKRLGKSKSEVVMIAAIPAVPVGYVGWKYVKFIKDILAKM